MKAQKIRITPTQTLRKVTLKTPNKRLVIRELTGTYRLMTMYDKAGRWIKSKLTYFYNDSNKTIRGKNDRLV